MFQELAQLLGKGMDATALNILITVTGSGDLSVTVIPKTGGEVKGDGVQALTQPLTLVASPAEMDAEFVNVIATYGAKRASLVEQLAATTAILDQAEKTSADTATKKLGARKAAAGEKKGPSKDPVLDDDLDEGADAESEADSASASGTVASPGSAPPPEDTFTTNLFAGIGLGGSPSETPAGTPT